MQGIEIDYCPECKGVWLDRGELEKIIERSNSYSQQYMDGSSHNYHDEHFHKKHHDDHHYDNHYDHSNEHNNYGYSGHKRKGFLSDLFDF